MNCLVKKEKKIIALLWSRSKSEKRWRISVNVHLDDRSSAAEPSVAKRGMVMQHRGPKCLLSSTSGSQWGLIWSNMSVSAISAELLIFLQPNLIEWYIIISWSVLCKNWIVIFRVTVKVQNYWIFLYLVFSVPLISWQPN